MPECGMEDSGSESDNKKSGSDSDSSSASSKSDSGSNSDSSASSLDSNKSKSNAGSKKSKSGRSASGSSSEDSFLDKSHDMETDDIKQCWEENPDIYGIRRSGRSKKEPDRLEVKSESERSGKKNRRGSSSASSTWHSSMSDSDTDKDEKQKPPRSRPPSRKLSKPMKPRPPPRDRPRKRRCSDSSDDSYDADIGPRRTVSRRAAAAVSYKEDTEDEATGSEEVAEAPWDESTSNTVAAPTETDNADTIEKILQTRRGKKGATGGPTTFYAVDENGDPNEGCDPEDLGNTEVQYLIKWKGWSHIHNTWESQLSLKENKVKGLKKLDNYIARDDDLGAWKVHATPEDIEYLECQMELQNDLLKSYTNVERVIAQVDKPDGGIDYFVKWENLPYCEASVEDGNIVTKKWPKKVEEFKEREDSRRTPSKSCRVLKSRPKFYNIKSQPEFIGGGRDLQLRDYQLDGLNWLVHSWCKENSAILADEMGLGKTIQTICFLYYLFRTHQLYGPFLLVVPLSTMTSWQREFSLWAPEMNFVVYLGDISSRNIIRDYEWYHAGTKKLKINAVITTYEIILKDKAFLGCISWAALLVDEAHRLKNDDSLLYKALFEFDTNHRLLITGTPLQNSLKELWALLHFIMPRKFEDWDAFERDHGNAAQKGYTKLHQQLEPYILRRVKKDVEKSLPAKVEQILRVEMSSLQKQYYKWILTKNYGALRKGVKGSTTTFNNIMIELKKCCNHALLTKPMDNEPKGPDFDPLQTLLRGSGKLVLLDKLLVRLKETGHRVLIFSQMVRMLDIIAEYLQLRRFPFQRLDGGIKGELRTKALDHFNAENSMDFCFLLSTRAGGLGINLATADTVIIYDSDWNPQNDLQAQARAHRIGQKNQVNIYRLITKSSVEEEIIERAKKKMVLDHLVIQRMDTTGRTVLDKKGASSTPFNKDDLNAILKFGAEELFKDEEEGDEMPACDIDEILKRAETAEEAPATVGDELLSAFKVASFAAFEEENDVPPVAPEEEEETKDWDDIIPMDYRKKVEEDERTKEMEDLYLPPRSRKTLQQVNESDDDKDKRKRKMSEDGSDEASDEERPRRRGRPKKNQLECEKPFRDVEIRRFIRAFKKFPNPLKRLEAVAGEAELQEKPLSDLRKLGEYIEKNCHDLMAEDAKAPLKDNTDANNEDSNASGAKKHRKRGPSFKIGGVSLNAKTLLATLKELEPLDEVLPSDPSARKKWILDARVRPANFDCTWDIEDDSCLLRGIYQYGLGSWEAIKMDPSLRIGEKILLPDDKKPQAKLLMTRCEYLLKVLKTMGDKKKGVSKAGRGGGRRKAKEVSKAIVEDTSEEENTIPSATPANDKKKPVKPKSDVEEEKEPEKKKEKEKKIKKEREVKPKKKKVQGPMHFTANHEPRALDVLGDLEPAIFNECKEKMRPVKKALKSLDNQDQSLTEQEQVSHTRLCLMQIGDQINKCLSEYKDSEKIKQWRSNLWYFVSKFTEFDAKKLYKLYKHEVKKEQERKQGGKETVEKEKDKEKSKDKDKLSKDKERKRERKDSDEKHVVKRKHEDDKEDNATPPKKSHIDGNCRDKRDRSRSHERDDRRSHKDLNSQRPGAAQTSSRHDYTSGDGRTTVSPHGRPRDRDRYSGDREHKRERYDGYNRVGGATMYREGRDGRDNRDSRDGRDRGPNHNRRPFHGGGPPVPGFAPYGPAPMAVPPYGVNMYPGDSNMYPARFPSPAGFQSDWRGGKDRDYRRDSYDRRPPTNS